jgi:dienelactone hydrolase
LRQARWRAAVGSTHFWGNQRFHIIVTESGSRVAPGGFSRGLGPGVTVSNESISATGFYGRFWRPPPGSPRRPGVLEFGWLARQPDVVASQIYVSGVSRGSEAALLLGVHYPKLVHGVIASSPADLSFGSYPDRGSAAWTYAGKPVPHSLSFSPDVPVLDPAAEIRVQQIHGPVLLDCGTADRTWTTCACAEAIQHRLTASHDRFPHVLYRYSGAGHFVGVLVPYQPGLMLVSQRDMGDTPLADLDSDARLWPHVLGFPSNPAAQTGTFTAPATPPPLGTS